LIVAKGGKKEGFKGKGRGEATGRKRKKVLYPSGKKEPRSPEKKGGKRRLERKK